MLLILLLLMRSCYSRLSIVSSTNHKTLIKSGKEGIFWCETNNPWFLCVWKGPSGLAITKTQGQEGCDRIESPDPRISLTGSGHTCRLRINRILATDGGSYSCVLTDTTVVQTVTRNITLQVGVVATVKWLEGDTIQHYQGEKRNLTCQSEGGHPRPRLVIRTDGNVQLTVSMTYNLIITIIINI